MDLGNALAALPAAPPLVHVAHLGDRNVRREGAQVMDRSSSALAAG